MATLNVFVLALFLVGSTLASNDFNEKTTCKNLKHQENFKVDQFVGLWYPRIVFDRTDGYPVAGCLAFDIVVYKNDSKVILKETMYKENPKTNKTEVVVETYFSGVAEDEALFTNKTLPNGRSFEQRCILATDYDNYAIASASKEGNGNRDHLVVMLTKDRSLARNDPIFKKAHNTIVGIIGNKSAETYEEMAQRSDCPEISGAVR